MSITQRVQEYLDLNNVRFELLPHYPAFPAQKTAQSLHVSGKHFAKSVVLHADDRLVMAVLPASHRLNLHDLRQELEVRHLEMAPESEVEKICSDCELGAFPPFGHFYGMETWVDRSLEKSEEIVFNAGTHTEAIRMKYSDYFKLAHPKLASFADPESLAA
ncbi:MAG: YbaK/EbsC family protein [Acidobacteriota bacterium]